MAPEDRKRLMIWLPVAALALAAATYRTLALVRPSPEGSAASNTTTAGAAADVRQGGAGFGEEPPANEALAVHLPALEAERPKPVSAERNLFRFKPKVMAPPPTSAIARMPPLPTGVKPGGPAPPPPITLKFIGIVEPERGGHTPKLAILSDGAGPPFYGSEGQIIAGRYRIIRIGVESVELAYADGSGRRTIRLSGG